MFLFFKIADHLSEFELFLLKSLEFAGPHLEFFRPSPEVAEVTGRFLSYLIFRMSQTPKILLEKLKTFFNKKIKNLCQNKQSIRHDCDGALFMVYKEVIQVNKIVNLVFHLPRR
jgi:hypothetical protein